MAAIYANNVAGTLAANVGPSDTQLLLGPGQGVKFPSPTGGNYFWITVVHFDTGDVEIMQCTARSVDTLTVVRGRDSTAAIAFVTGSVVEMRMVAQALRDADWHTAAGVANGVATLDATGKLNTAQIPLSVLTEAEASTLYVPLTQKGIANGVATLDAGIKIPIAQIPVLSSLYLDVADRGVANGVASLDAGGLIPVAQIPSLSATYLTKTNPSATGTFVTTGTIQGTDLITTSGVVRTTGTTLVMAADNSTLYLRPVSSASATGQATLTTAGLFSAADFGFTSDIRMKKHVRYYGADPYLADKLKLAEWDWKETPGGSKGLVAQDLLQISAHLVRKGEDGMYNIDKAQVALESVIGLAIRVKQLEDAHAS